MKRTIESFMILQLLSAASADALSLNVLVRDPQQVGQTTNAQFGLVVSAFTEFWALSVGGGFTVTCPDSQVIEAQASDSFWDLFGSVSLWVNVPRSIPGQYTVTGWPGWRAPSTQSCSFRYVGRAKEGIFTIGGAGSSITFGGGDKSEGDTRIFKMVKPLPGTGAGPGTCIP